MILQKTTELLKYFRFNSRKSYQLSLTVTLCPQYSIVEDERGILKKLGFHTTQLRENVQLWKKIIFTGLFPLNQLQRKPVG